MNPIFESIFAAERIDHQHDNFGQALEGLVAQILNDFDDQHLRGKELAGTPYVGRIEQLVFRRLKMKVRIKTNAHTAAILPFYSNKHHIFLPDILRGILMLRDQNKILAQAKDKQGTVNLHTATLGGLFSEYTHPLYLNFTELVDTYRLTAAQITGVILHELGHGFDACYYADRTDENNQVMANVLRVITNHDKASDLDYVYRELSSMTPDVTKEEVDKLLNGPKVIAGSTWFNIVLRTVRSHLREDKYNESSFEEGADAFATRFGYGKELILALDAMHRSSPEKSAGARTVAYLSEFLGMATLACAVMASIVTGAAGLAMFFSIFSVVLVRASGEDSVDYTYDALKQRYTRIRNQAVDFLKDTDIPKEAIKSALETIDNMDQALSQTKEYKSLFTGLSNFLFSDARNARDAIKMQQMMESLASNELFVEAARFKTL